MTFGNVVRSGMTATVLALTSALAQAGAVTSLSAFNTAVSVTATETFEAITATTLRLSDAGNNPISIFGSDGTLGQASPVNTPVWLANLIGAEVTKENGGGTTGRTNTTTPGQYWLESDAGFTVKLKTAVQAFGFWGTDFGDFGGTLAVDLYIASTTLVAANVMSSINGTLFTGGNGTVNFAGYSSADYFDEIRFRIGQNPATDPDPNNDEAPRSLPISRIDVLGFDDLMIGNLKAPPTGGEGNSVPEPTSIALLGLGLLAASRFRRINRSV